MRLPQPVGPAYGAGYLPFYVIPTECGMPMLPLVQSPPPQTLFGSHLVPSFIRGFSTLPSVWLFVAQCLYNCARSRQRDEAAGKYTATTHPLSSCVCDLLVNLAGGLCVSVFTATPLPALQAPYVAVTAVLCWYVVNHSPCDAVWRLWDYTLVKMVLCVLCEHRRMQCMAAGLDRARHTYPAPEAWPAAVAGGFMHSMGPVAMECLLHHLQARDLAYPIDYTPDTQVRLLSLHAFMLVLVGPDVSVRLADPPTVTAIFAVLAAENAVLGILGERFPRLRQALNQPIPVTSQPPARPPHSQSPPTNVEQQPQQQSPRPSLSPEPDTTQSPPPPPLQQQQQQQQAKEIQQPQASNSHKEDEAERNLIRSLILTGCCSFVLSAYLTYNFLLSSDWDGWWE